MLATSYDKVVHIAKLLIWEILNKPRWVTLPLVLLCLATVS